MKLLAISALIGFIGAVITCYVTYHYQRSPQNMLNKRENVKKRKKREYTEKHKKRQYMEMSGYSVISKLGEGGFGKVYKVKSKRDGKLYAIKETKLSGNKTYDDKIMREVVNGKQLKHKNIVRLFTYFIHEKNAFNDISQLYQKLELCDYSLSDWFSKNLRNRTDEICTQMFRDIALGLQYIHIMKFIHRDLKPANILIDKNGTCKIADFGLLVLHKQRYENLVQYYHSFGIGTPIYASPEQMQGNKYNFKADIFPMGCILMEFYTEFNTIDQLIKALEDLRRQRFHLKFFQNFKSNTVRYDHTKNLILRMTENDPIQRPSINDVINDKFFTGDLQQN